MFEGTMKRLLLILVLFSSVSWGQNAATTIILIGSNAKFKAWASSISTTSFTANWKLLKGGTSYTLDVATDVGFTSYVSGYQAKSVTGTSQAVSGLTAATVYYMRVNCTAPSGSTKTTAIVQLTTTATAEKYFLTADTHKFKTADTKYYTLP